MGEKAPSRARFSVLLLTVALFGAGCGFLALGWYLSCAVLSAQEGAKALIRSEKLRGRIVHMDEVLTMSARMAAATGEPRWQERYKQFERELDRAIKEAMELAPELSRSKTVAQTDSANAKLVAMEHQAFALVRDGKTKDASALLFSDAYEEQKRIYSEGMTKYADEIKRELHDSLRLANHIGLCALATAAVGFTVSFGAWLILIRKLHVWRRALEHSLAERERIQGELARHRDHLEELVQERTAELEAAHGELIRNERLATMGLLVAKVSHELRNPLMTLAGSIFLVAQKTHGADEEIDMALARGQRAVHRCDGIIEELLDFTRAQEHELCLEPTDIDQWAPGVLEEQEVPDWIAVKTEFASGVHKNVDRERLRRCIVSLVTNACEAMGAVASGPLPERPADKEHVLTVASMVADGRLHISVTDTGDGIAPEDLGNVLKPLYSTKSFGVGLGLPTVQEIIEQHGGGVAIKSEIGKGATVTLWLPLSPAAEPVHVEAKENGREEQSPA